MDRMIAEDELRVLRNYLRKEFGRPEYEEDDKDDAVGPVEFVIARLEASCKVASDRGEWRTMALKASGDYSTLLHSIAVNEGLAARHDVEKTIQRALDGVRAVAATVSELESLLAMVKLRSVEKVVVDAR